MRLQRVRLQDSSGSCHKHFWDWPSWQRHPSLWTLPWH